MPIMGRLRREQGGAGPTSLSAVTAGQSGHAGLSKAHTLAQTRPPPALTSPLPSRYTDLTGRPRGRPPSLSARSDGVSLDCYVFFDVDDTLVQWNLTWQDAFVQVAREAGVECTAERAVKGLEEAFTGVYQECLRKHAPNGELREFWLEYDGRILAMLGVDHDLRHHAGRLWDLLQDPKATQLYPEVPETLRTLTDRGAKLGIVTGRPVAYPDLDRLGVAHYFAPVLDAFGTRSTKDEGVMFGLAVEAARGAGRPAWYVGDNYAMDVLGARAAGLRPILVDRHSTYPAPDCPRVTDLREIADLVRNGK